MKLYLENYITQNAHLLDLAQQINFLSTLECNFRWSVHRWPSGQLRGLKSYATDRKINICGEKRGAGGANSTVKIRDHRPVFRSRITYRYFRTVRPENTSRHHRRRARGQHQFPSFIVPFARFLSRLFLLMFFSKIGVK